MELEKNLPEISNFSERLKWARAQMAIEQQELAELADINRSTISIYESGARDPNMKNIRKLASALQVDSKWLANGVGGVTKNEPISAIKQERPIEQLYEELKAYRDREKVWQERERTLLDLLSRTLPPAASLGKLLAKEGKAVRFLVANQGAPLVSRAA